MLSYRCFKCELVTPIKEETIDCCPNPSCSSIKGEILSTEKVEQGLESGAIFHIDPKTGKRKK
jgi:hypothetical protein